MYCRVPANDVIGIFITYLLCRFVNRRPVNNSKNVSEHTWIWIVYWRHVKMTIIHQDQDQGGLSPALTREVNLAIPFPNGLGQSYTYKYQN